MRIRSRAPTRLLSRIWPCGLLSCAALAAATSRVSARTAAHARPRRSTLSPLFASPQLTLAGSVVYSYVTVLPLLLWLLLRYYEAGKRLVDILCIYGYTLGIFVPISVLCVLPSDILRWLLVLVGGGISGVFLLSNFHAHFSDCFPYGESEAKRKMYILLGGMCFFHVLLLFLFKLYFFHYQ